MKKTVADFQIQYTRFLDEEGKVQGELPEFAREPAQLLELYRWMVILRALDTKAINLQRTGKLGTYASTLGQEAVGVGIGHAMRRDDVLCPAYREYGAMLQRGVKFSEILLFWGGDERGCNYANNPYDFPMCVPIGTQALHGVGVARAFQLKNEDRVAVVVLGDGGTSQGDFYEAINVAGTWKLPIVFVISNNQWAISLPRERQTAAQTLAQKGIAAGLPSEQVDGNDVIAVRDSVANALARARAQQGATVIEAVTYRLTDHTTADDASRYWDKQIVEKAKLKEPLIRLRKYLQQSGHLNEALEKKFQAEGIAIVDSEIKDYLNTPAPAAENMLDYLYAELPDAMAEQYAELIETGATTHA